MRRCDKYQDTDTFKFYNANPHNRLSDDCAVRAICTATGISWEDVMTGLFSVGIKYGYVPTDKTTIEKYLNKLGLVKSKQVKKSDGTKYTGKEFCKLADSITTLPIICNIGGHHMVCVKAVNGKHKIHDIWDSTKGCVGNFWICRPNG